MLSRNAIGVALAITLTASAAQAATPHQFIAKAYTEILGRIPDQGGYQGGLNHFNANGCTKATLKSWGRGVFLSTEYTNLGYDNASKLLTAYRAILNREPDAGGFAFWLGQLDGGVPFINVVDSLFDSTEFNGLVTSICKAATSTADATYGFGNGAVIDLPILGSCPTCFAGTTQAQLQTALNSAPAGGTVWLKQRQVIRLTSTLDIPAGKTLATINNPDHNQYANMARLVRDSSFDATMVKLVSGSKLKNVWVDGSRGRLGFTDNALNVQLYGGTNSEVSGCVISNAAGWSSLQAFGRTENQTCGSNFIRNNLITAYSSLHFGLFPGAGKGWTDGLSIACENATVENNEIVDATDVPIVVFRACPAVQASQVRFNTMLNAGNSSYGGLVADALTPAFQNAACTGTPSFVGASVNNNTFWTGAGHYDIAISVGTRAWFGTSSITATGASFQNNTGGSQPVRCRTGIGVSGMLNTTVLGNTFTRTALTFGSCPSVQVGASVSQGYASGTLQAYSDVLIQGCIGH